MSEKEIPVLDHKKNYYNMVPIKCKVQGHRKIGLDEDWVVYDSKLEARAARLLIQNGIRFKPHQKFKVYDRDGKPFHYTIDFLFYEPIELLGISSPITALEVKGVLTRRDLLRIDALKYNHQIKCYYATNTLIDLWEREGINK